MDLCSDIPFWNQTLTWDTNIPTFTRCFRRTCLSMLPMAIFWFFIPFIVLKLHKNVLATIQKTSILSMTKYLLAGVLCGLAILDFIYWILDEKYMILDLVEPIFRIVTFVAIIALIRVRLAFIKYEFA